MIFNSVTYLALLATTGLLYWVLPRRPRLWLLLLASLAFYGFWRYEFLPVMLASVVVSYLAALCIERDERPLRRKLAVAICVAVNLGILGYFKYAVFVLDNINGLAELFGFGRLPLELKVVLPLGISFYTFQSLSYVVDVYRRFVRAERDFVLLADYILFFPQLVAGPILRAREVVWQLDRRARFDMADVAEGSRRILAGLFLKVVLADNLAEHVEAGFAAPRGALGGLDVWTLAFLFGFQIYFDFSAYSHIAVGSARLMGIRLPENFDFPYLAASPREFWRRWHISLSSWIRDYLYLPLKGATVEDRSTGGLAAAAEAHNGEPGRWSAIIALVLTWAIMGLWHGANWAFVFWGLWHAALVLAYRLFARLGVPSFPGRRTLGWVLTLALVMLGWIPFRSRSLEATLELFGRLASPTSYLRLGLRENSYLLAASALALVLTAAFAARHLLPWLAGRPALRLAAETTAFTAMVGLVIVYLRPVTQFIYFQF